MKLRNSSPANGDNGSKTAKSDPTPTIKCSADHRDNDFEYWPRPSELELTRWAVQLARTGKMDPRQLVEEAWALYWESCRKIQQDHRAQQAFFENEGLDNDHSDEIEYYAQASLPTPAEYPVTFHAMELLLLPKLSGRTAERATVFREYFFASLMGWNCPGLSKNPTSSYWNCPGPELDQTRNKESIKNEVARIFAKWRKTVFDAQAYSAFATKFLRWYREWNAIRNSEVKAINALKGWEKRRQSKQARTGARPNRAALKEILNPSKKPS
jgi:hypothetical protein